MCFLSFEDQIVLRRTNTNKIISTFWRTAEPFLSAKWKIFWKMLAKAGNFGSQPFFICTEFWNKRERIADVKMLRHIVLSWGGQLDPRSIVKRDEVFTPVVYMDLTSDKVEMWNLCFFFFKNIFFKNFSSSKSWMWIISFFGETDRSFFSFLM